VEDVGVEELQYDHAGFFIASMAELRHHPEPVVIRQLLTGHPFDDIEQRLGHQPLELAEGRLLEDRAYMRFAFGSTFPQDHLTNLAEQGRRLRCELLLELLLPLNTRQPRQLSAGELQEPIHLVVDVRAIRRRGCPAASQQLRDVGLGHLRGAGELALLQAEFLEPLSDDQ
jgi:hypothetical protein